MGKPDTRKRSSEDSSLDQCTSSGKYRKLSENESDTCREVLEKRLSDFSSSLDTQEYKLSCGLSGDSQDSNEINGRFEPNSTLSLKQETASKNDGEESNDSADTLILSDTGEGTDVEVNQNIESTALGVRRRSTLPFPKHASGRSESVIKDADVITQLIPDVDAEFVLDSLVKHRADPDRLNLVTATVLDSGLGGRKDKFTDDEQQRAIASPSGDGGAVASNSNSRGKRESEQTLTSQQVPFQQITEQGGVTTNGGLQGVLYEEVKKVIMKVKTVKPNVDINPTQVYLLLEQSSGQADRIKHVAHILLNTSGLYGPIADTATDSVFNRAMQLTGEFPEVDPSLIYELLERARAADNSLQDVRQRLTAMSAPAVSTRKLADVPKEDSIPNDPLFRDDPVYHDMRLISKMFPGKDQNELYAMVEAHYYKKDRVQVVIEELLFTERSSQGDSLESHPPARLISALSVSEWESAAATPASTQVKAVGPKGGDLLHSDVSHLRAIFPDCDPNHIFERLEACPDVADRVKIVAAEMFEQRDYPRLKETVERQTKAARKRHLHGLRFTLEDVLAKFPHAVDTFSSTEKEMKQNYKTHLTALLKHDFPDFKQSYVNSVVESHNHHLSPILKELEAQRAEILARGGHSKKMRAVSKEEPLTYPEEPDEYFFYELWFSRNEQRVRDYFEEKESARKAKVEMARARQELYECHCCFEDECLFEEMNVCGDGHLFCQDCIARSAEAAFGEGKTSFPCLTGCCEHQIPVSVLKQVLPAAMFSKILRKLQEEEVRQAGIPDLVDCPFCSFATIMSNPDDHVFRCLNPECLKDSCRLCREPNHVPLKCDEVEKQSETDMRTFIEKRVTEAILRKCHRCKKRFVKDAGCNMMTCVCGATSCYVCREPDIAYDHFGGNRCNEGDMSKLHQQEMTRAATEAKGEYLRNHPEAADISLKYDPLKNLENGNVFETNDDYDDEDHDDDENYDEVDDSDDYDDD